MVPPMNIHSYAEKSLSVQLADAHATLTFGARLGGLLTQYGIRTVLLFGRLGCGKTTLVRGLVADFPGGHKAEVSSPSFTLCNIYPTKPPVVHCDLYRSDEPMPLPTEAQDLLDGPSGILLAEWAERLIPAERPMNRLDIRLIPCQEGRLVTLCPHGEAARLMLAEMAKDPTSA